MADTDFNVEQLRLAAARHLPVACYDDFQRLSRTLVHGPELQWLLVDACDETLRRQVMAALDEVLRAAGMTSNRLPLSDKISDVTMLEARLVKNARAAAVVHVIGRPGWFDAVRLGALNVRRERLASEARARLVFWLDADAISLMSREAPDFWAWRGGVYTFVADAVPASALDFSGMAIAPGGQFMPLSPGPVGSDNRSMAQRSRRVAEIRTWLARKPAPPDELLAAPLDELGDLLFDLGDYEEALQHWRQVVLPFHQRLGDARSKAVTMGKIADIVQARGQLDEALRIRREEQLSVYERLGDVRLKVVTLGKIADILQARGQHDEALRIRREEQLPVFERLGDVRCKAVTMGQIADILQVRGELDEALRIRQEEELPVFERLGDMHRKAVTMGRIADILQARGQLDEAMHIRQEEELPVYERLGDVRSKAVTMGNIAGILQDRGQFDEALRIHEDRLATFAQLGDVHGLTHVKFSIARLLIERGVHGGGEFQFQAIYDNLAEAFAISVGTGHAVAIARIGFPLAQVMAMRGLIDEALAVLIQAEAANTALGWESGLKQINQLRQEIQASLPDPLS